jgi:HSP20 family protein
MPTAVLERQETKGKSEQKRVYRAPIALYESGESYTVLVELPGADQKAVQVRLDKGVLTIEAPLKLDLPPGSVPKYSEMHLGDYRRTLDLADQIDEENIEASFTGGLLKLTLPKGKSAKARKIPIKTT